MTDPNPVDATIEFALAHRDKAQVLQANTKKHRGQWAALLADAMAVIERHDMRVAYIVCHAEYSTYIRRAPKMICDSPTPDEGELGVIFRTWGMQAVSAPDGVVELPMDGIFLVADADHQLPDDMRRVQESKEKRLAPLVFVEVGPGTKAVPPTRPDPGVDHMGMIKGNHRVTDPIPPPAEADWNQLDKDADQITDEPDIDI